MSTWHTIYREYKGDKMIKANKKITKLTSKMIDILFEYEIKEQCAGNTNWEKLVKRMINLGETYNE